MVNTIRVGRCRMPKALNDLIRCQKALMGEVCKIISKISFLNAHFTELRQFGLCQFIIGA